jgi:hypothetical protein
MLVKFHLPDLIAFSVLYFRRLSEAWYNAKCDLIDIKKDPHNG